MRKLNTTKLKDYLVLRGKMGKEALAVESGISFIKIERILRGTRSATKPEMITLCSVTGLKLDDLFPEVAD
jgi:hypothetical protein